MIDIGLLTTLFAAHFVGDFLFQTDWMAMNKSQRWDALAAHVGVYAVTLGLFTSIALPPAPYPYADTVWFSAFVAVNAALHFVTDAVTSRATSRLWFLPTVGFGMRPNWIQVEVKNTRHWFFVLIGLDQLIHVLTLLWTAHWWLL